MNRRLDWEIRNVIETNTCVVNWEIHLRYTWCWVTMNRRLDWEIRNAGETNTSVVKVRNTLDKNLAKLGEDTLGAPATMLVNFFWVSQLILKIHAWAVPKMPHFGENSDIWLRYRPSKLKSHFLGTSFSRLTFFKVRRGPCLTVYILGMPNYKRQKRKSKQRDLFCALNLSRWSSARVPLHFLLIPGSFPATPGSRRFNQFNKYN